MELKPNFGSGLGVAVSLKARRRATSTNLVRIPTNASEFHFEEPAAIPILPFALPTD